MCYNKFVACMAAICARGVPMAKILELQADHEKELCLVGKALSSPTRIDIIKLITINSYNIGEIAEKLGIPASSAAMHVRVLESAGLINTEVQPGERGAMKLCSRKSDYITIRLVAEPQSYNETVREDMPIGAYTDCSVTPTCGLASDTGNVGREDKPNFFYSAERVEAQLLWFSTGYVEYRFPAPEAGRKIKQLSLSMEICSEAPNFREDWKSDITLWLNGVDCGTWTSPGDFGARRGRLTPDWWPDGNTQYGLLTTWSLSEDASRINGQVVSQTGLANIPLTDAPYLTVRIGNKPGARYQGGVNLFGAKFGDYPQDIVMSIVY